MIVTCGRLALPTAVVGVGGIGVGGIGDAPKLQAAAAHTM
jgi:hypothetical protein